MKEEKESEFRWNSLQRLEQFELHIVSQQRDEYCYESSINRLGQCYVNTLRSLLFLFSQALSDITLHFVNGAFW